ncbi:MAG TPA: hypothetical protein VHL31_02880 [Geminicoccus sp.]|jgi:hypothetical protein|uniref:hypothetical protein n=1 Tax=Geminicoccus sp. TaxID=2024832 RepID=UPI002E37C104|nr:hypothetical protein [Geminicoccus sp.]HEX2525231.1 hypothetical protein [Geminicoccus sp.]
MERAYSVAQIQFECLRYIKEFGAEPAAWVAGTCTDPQLVLGGRATGGVVWLTKPALTPRAARMVVDWLHRRYGVVLASSEEWTDGRYVFLIHGPSSSA